ncbi:RCC1/BLIP-II protein [Nadsonia fulvescens var. elongata DSM 6958]|uniref:RCC1/BLIP-II protein n=1 Tax=Nadsonia fulvescens var. elongata DSM 6958 TaxID=857566 RepID=A0A1E3PH65_9ASCO|nr:RCC1/BLIP-II protein [Nadsonia fulvescens var. elongata DSM 6958]
MPLIDLGDDILIDNVFPYLAIRDLLALSGSCRDLHALVTLPSVWHDLYYRNFGIQPTPFDKPQPQHETSLQSQSQWLTKWPEIFKFRSTAHLYTWGASSLGRLGLDLGRISSSEKSVPSGNNVGNRLGAFEPGIVKPNRVTTVDQLAIADVTAGGFSFTILTTHGEIVGIGDLQKFLPRPGGPGGRGGIVGGRGVFGNHGTGDRGDDQPLRFVGGPNHRIIPHHRPVDYDNNHGSESALNQRIPLMGGSVNELFTPFRVGGIVRNAQTHHNGDHDTDNTPPETNPIASQSSPMQLSLPLSSSTTSRLVKAESLSLPLTLSDRSSPKTLSTDTILQAGAEFQGGYTVNPTLQNPRFISISSGREHLIALDERNNIWMWDRSFTERGKLLKFDFGSIVTSQGTQLPKNNPRVIKIMAGWNFSAALFEGIGLVVWFDLGECLNEQSEGNGGYRCNYSVVGVPNLLSQSDGISLEVVDFMTGHCFLILLDQEGGLYKLVDVASLESVSRSQPRRLVEFDNQLKQLRGTSTKDHRKFVKLSGSYRTFAAFTDGDDVFLGHIDTAQPAVGSRNEGDLGDHSQPMILPELQQTNVISISVGDYHCLALQRGGSVLSWGVECKNCGCLGMGKAEDVLARYEGQLCDDGEKLCESVNAGLKLRRPRKVDFRKAGEDNEEYVLAIAAAGWQSCAIVSRERL